MGKFQNFLQESDLFFSLSAPQLELVEGLCEELVFQNGETIFSENSRGKELYLILRGKVEILLNPSLVSAESKKSTLPEVIATLRRGQSFGEIALVDEGIRSASARAGEDETHLLKLPRNKFMLLCNLYPELGYRVMFNLAVDLSQKLRNTDLKLRETLLYRQAPKQES
jgi:CRP-like cAMP-binding protein